MRHPKSPPLRRPRRCRCRRCRPRGRAAPLRWRAARPRRRRRQLGRGAAAPRAPAESPACRQLAACRSLRCQPSPRRPAARHRRSRGSGATTPPRKCVPCATEWTPAKPRSRCTTPLGISASWTSRCKRRLPPRRRRGSAPPGPAASPSKSRSPFCSRRRPGTLQATRWFRRRSAQPPNCSQRSLRSTTSCRIAASSPRNC
mmetsp:Transcript_68467/g.222802  ORF Transcript_68467/g.222802 Transcript_68467/m.222802 type:complete len:201 (+) Transcript_68467:172-774(+)